MARPTSTSGFTLLEVCIVILAMSVLTLLFLPVREMEVSSFYTFPDAYLLAQSEAIRKAEKTMYYSDSPQVPDISFNEKGNVNKAMTLRFPDRAQEIIIELGGGRLVFR